MGALVVYSVTDRDSFNAVEKWIGQVNNKANPNCSIILVANKADVADSERTVSTEEGDQLAEKHGLEFYEVSAMENTGISEAMNALARHMTIKYESLAGEFDFNS